MWCGAVQRVYAWIAAVVLHRVVWMCCAFVCAMYARFADAKLWSFIFLFLSSLPFLYQFLASDHVSL